MYWGLVGVGSSYLGIESATQVVTRNSCAGQRSPEETEEVHRRRLEWAKRVRPARFREQKKIRQSMNDLLVTGGVAVLGTAVGARDRVELRRRVLETRRRVCRPSGRRPVRCPRRPPICKLGRYPPGTGLVFAGARGRQWGLGSAVVRRSRGSWKEPRQSDARGTSRVCRELPTGSL